MKCSLRLIILFVFCLLYAIPAHSTPSPPPGDYPAITGPCDLQFPRDHGAHEAFRTEWWYYTGNVRSESGERFGFQLTFFRSRLGPPGHRELISRDGAGSRLSAWRTRQVFMAHAAVAAIDARGFRYSERMGRGALGLAGAVVEGETVSVFVKDWSLRLDPEGHHLKATGDDFSLDFVLKPRKAPTLHGELGYSRKGSTPERASCYYSFTRLEAEGTLNFRERAIPVRGWCWMDHEFNSAPLEPDLSGWDWISLQLADNTELMVCLLRRKDGTHSPASYGTFTDAEGVAHRLRADDFVLETLDQWTSPHSGARYPARRRLRVPPLELDMNITPSLADQELKTDRSTRVTYWEGSVSTTGSVRGKPVQGEGYMELTGYVQPFDAPM